MPALSTQVKFRTFPVPSVVPEPPASVRPEVVELTATVAPGVMSVTTVLPGAVAVPEMCVKLSVTEVDPSPEPEQPVAGAVHAGVVDGHVAPPAELATLHAAVR